MEQREKLIELLSDFYYSDSSCDSCEHNLETDYECNQCIIEHEVDHLIANGVVVLPCRCCECDNHTDEEPGMVYCPQIVGGWVSNNSFCSGAKKRVCDL